MKKIVSVVLSVLMMLSLVTPAFADDYTKCSVTSSVPVIYISGDSNPIFYDKDDPNSESFKIDNVLNIFDTVEDDSVRTAVVNILTPFIFEGVITGNWDAYYEAVYKEVSELFEPVRLDENGNVPNNSGIATNHASEMRSAVKQNRKNAQGRYEEESYHFYYDWRLDPIVLADELNAYIEAVKKVTKHDKVALTVKCLGSNVVMAYIVKYGTASLKGVGLDVSTSLGADFLSGIMSGKFGIDGAAISRLLSDLKMLDGTETDPLLSSTLELLSSTGVISKLSDVARAEIYGKIEYGLISAIALSTFMTMPGYWALVTVDDFDDAIERVFGAEDDPRREQYAGLIKKITDYNEKIKKNVIPITKTLEDNGVNICVVSKYGLQMVPLLKDGSVLGDQYVSVEKSSYGATTSDIYSTLSDEYIESRIALGLGKYISPDKQIDASTCFFPDFTWFFKGVSHGYYIAAERDLIMTVIDADRQLTVEDSPLTRFTVYDNANHITEAMNEENCHNESWEADKVLDRPTTKAERILSLIVNLVRWVRNLLDFLFDKLSLRDTDVTTTLTDLTGQTL